MDFLQTLLPWLTGILTLAAALRKFVVSPWIHDGVRRDKLALRRMDLLFEELDALRNEMRLLRLVMMDQTRVGNRIRNPVQERVLPKA
jgi:hypothetical protein